MEVEHFDIGIHRVEEKDEKVYYVVLVQYKDLKYEVNRRYSEFEELHCELLHFGFSALPNLPKKKLMSYKNYEYINYRKKILNIYIQNLFMRPDIRCCALFLNFLLFYDKINISIDIVRTKLLNSIGSQKFSVSDLYINDKENYLICVYEDKSNLSKLGKLWSIIEPDLVGEIKIFSYNNDLTSTFIETYREQTIYKARNIICSEKKNEVIISGDDGKIHIYKIDLELLTLIYIKNIPCHNDTILKMMLINDQFFCTCGYDNAFRLINLHDYKIISGGRCNKRLDKDKITTCHLLEFNNIIIGTTSSLFFVYNMTCNPPIYLDTKKLKNGENITCFTNTEKYLFVGYDNIIACYNYHYSNDNKSTKSNNAKKDIYTDANVAQTEGSYNNISTSEKSTYAQCDHADGNSLNHRNVHNSNSYGQNICQMSMMAHQNPVHSHRSTSVGETANEVNTPNTEKEQHITKLFVDNNISAQYVPPLLYDSTVLSLSVNKEKKILYAGYEDAIVLWSIVSGLIISSFHGHTNGVHFLKYLKSSEFLLSGGNAGNLKIWKSDIDNFKIWKPKKNYKMDNIQRKGFQMDGTHQRHSLRVSSQMRDGSYAYTMAQQNNTNFNCNFNFNESDHSDRECRSSQQSESMSIDNLLEETNKKHVYEICDTSNYKKNFANYNESTNVNSMNSSRSNLFCEKRYNEPNEFTSDVSNLDVCIITNKNSKMKKDSYEYNVDNNFNSTCNSLKTASYDYNLKRNPSHGYPSNDNIKYDSTSAENVKNSFEEDYNKIDLNSKSQYDNNLGSYKQSCANKMEVDENIPYRTDLQEMNYHYAGPQQMHNDPIMDKDNSIVIEDINEKESVNDFKKNIVYVSDEDDDLISAFR
ncbi:WD domain G-beta repeat domain containing protein [Plasmodium ovale wallikeri]|uniref:WD domain G-beta repeat domain containing protein n=2 Tax=Plasmodium ovale TaxID=36330 RepID=A0A1A8YFP0_PLAOA|nr:WD domain G-beta repeat domain containing protein [Plasmodium ovale wallikeri]SBT30732.1 WD domain G-beta repeat domain containing protein [Plasmodium ovale wallikeri]SBT75114.1 phosphoinositide-binding protein, putative [Plasmodium ovale]